MPWFIYPLADGTAFFCGAALFAVAVFLRHPSMGRGRRRIFIATLIVAIALITVSAAPLPSWMYAVWIAAAVIWLIAPKARKPRDKVIIKCALLLITLAAIVHEAIYFIGLPLPVCHYSRLYVVGDSISAGIGNEHGDTWPRLIAREHHVEVADLSRAGANLTQAKARVSQTSLRDGLVLLEIGGNDMLDHVPPAKFESDLEALLAALEGPDRQLVMIELPLLPFDNAYGVAQRRCARKHGVSLIPKRCIVQIIRPADATVDGIHLTASGQRRMAEMLWSRIGRNLKRWKP